MGIQGTEVAKESSDIIILDDNFASVVKVKEKNYTSKLSWKCIVVILSFVIFGTKKFLFSES